MVRQTHAATHAIDTVDREQWKNLRHPPQPLGIEYRDQKPRLAQEHSDSSTIQPSQHKFTAQLIRSNPNNRKNKQQEPVESINPCFQPIPGNTKSNNSKDPNTKK